MLAAYPFMRLGSAFAQNPVQTARGIFQVTCYLSVGAWIILGANGYRLAKNYGEPQATRTYDTCGDNLTGETTGGETSGALGDMASTEGTLDNWISDGLKCAGVEDSTANHEAMRALIQRESSGDYLAIQQVLDENSYAAGAGGLPDGRARGLTQITPSTWEQYAPASLKPASSYIFKPRASVCVRALTQMSRFGYLDANSSY